MKTDYKSEITSLKERIRELEQENKRLRFILDKIEPPAVRPASPETPVNTAISVDREQTEVFNKYRSPQEKIALFRALFRGREDVFARRWQSVKSGKSGYVPVCANEWKVGVCLKPRGNCGSCERRESVPLSDTVLDGHLRGRDLLERDVIGIYPILPDDRCCFLALDFDDDGWQTEVALVRRICAEWCVPCAVERSRSGNGAHLWLFFSEPVFCTDARRLGTALLTTSMEREGKPRLSAYDRMFPNQDTLPKGGFGNLIALPLQGQARKHGNSVFVDEAFCVYEDQWAFLATIEKITPEALAMLLQLHCRGDALGSLMQSDDTSKPWEQKKRITLGTQDIPKEAEIIEGNLLYLKTEDFSARARDQLIRLAAFKNPDFYRAQAMRLPIYNKPRVIHAAETRDGYLALPRGCKEALTALIEEAGGICTYVDRRNPGRPIQVHFQGELRPEQRPAAAALLANETGVLSAATAFGKTVIASWLISQRKTNTLILVHTQALLNQWRNALNEFLILDETLPEPPKRRGRKRASPLIGQLGGGKNTLSGLVDVVILQSLLSGDEVNEIVRNYGMVIVDECHHVSAVTFEHVMKEVNARYVCGLSATPTRQDGHHPIVLMQCGPIRYLVDAKEQAAKHDFLHYIVPRFTAFRTSVAEEKGIAALYSDLAGDERRNALIVEDTKSVLSQGRSPILLTERREHVERLAALIRPFCQNVFTLYGTVSSRQRRDTLDAVQHAPPEAPLCIIATGKYVGEGFDCPRLDTLLLTLPVAWKGTVAQYAGRLHRSYPGKNEVWVYDYVDVHVPVLERMYQKRLKGYASIGYQIKSGAEFPDEKNLIYDGQSFYPVYCKDLATAKAEILIVSPFTRKSRLQNLVKQLAEPILNGTTVKVITRPQEDFPEKQRAAVETNLRYLQDYGVHIVCRSQFHQKFTVIDRSLVWYGSVNFLSFGSAEESIMRLESPEIAGELIDSITRQD